MSENENGMATLLNKMTDQIQEIAKERTGYQQLKFWVAAIIELSFARKIFNKVKVENIRILAAFGSARTPEDHPAFKLGVELGRIFAKKGWKALTGAGTGIMGAVHRGAGREHALGVNIELPFEQLPNEVIKDSIWLATFKFFFGRKIAFVENSDAVVALPGGFGTFDEMYEVLTLMQTGKADLRPFVFLDVKGGEFWKDLDSFHRKHLFNEGYLSPEDENLYVIMDCPYQAFDYCEQFYKRYHSMYHFEGATYIRLQADVTLTQDQLNQIYNEFSDIISGTSIELITSIDRDPSGEIYNKLPRLKFIFQRKEIGKLRKMIDRLNSF